MLTITSGFINGAELSVVKQQFRAIRYVFWCAL